MSRGRRYEEPKLNLKKVFGVVIGFIVFIMVIVSIVKLVNNHQKTNQLTVTAYFPMLADNKWGVIDNKGNVIIQPTYDEMFTIPNNQKGVFITQYDIDETAGTFKTKVFNEKGEQLFSQYAVIEPIDNYDNSNIWFEDDVLKIKEDGKYGLINFKGEKLLPTVYDEIDSIKGVKNSLIIEKDGFFGVCNNLGNIIVNPIYKSVQAAGKTYQNGYIIVTTADRYGLIGIDKNIILEPEYEQIKYIGSSSIYAIKTNGKMYLIDSSTKTTYPIGFDSIEKINGENVIIKTGNLYGVVDKQGAVKVPSEYQSLEYAFSNYFIAKKDNKYGIVDDTGNKVIEFSYIKMTCNELGKFIQADIDDIESVIYNSNLDSKITGVVSEVNNDKGYIKVRVGQDYKYYNFQLEEKSNRDIFTSNTLFLVKENGKYGYVNKDGKLVVNYIYDDAKEQNAYGYCVVQKDGKWGCLNSNGAVEQDTVLDLSNNLHIDFIAGWHLNITGDYYTKG